MSKVEFVAEALQEVGDLKRFLKGTLSTVQTMIDSQSTNKDIHVDLHACLTTRGKSARRWSFQGSMPHIS